MFIFGLILPTFLFFAFFVGRELDIHRYFPGFLAMSLFFTSSSVGPLIVPWEKQQGTFERLLSYPVSIGTIVLGDMIAGALFGLMISTIVGVAGIFLIPIAVTDVVLIFIAFVLGQHLLLVPRRPALLARGEDAGEHHDAGGTGALPSDLRLRHLHPGEPDDRGWRVRHLLLAAHLPRRCLERKHRAGVGVPLVGRHPGDGRFRGGLPGRGRSGAKEKKSQGHVSRAGNQALNSSNRIRQGHLSSLKWM